MQPIITYFRGRLKFMKRHMLATLYMCSFLVWKNACLYYREFDLEGDLVGVPHIYRPSLSSIFTIKTYLNRVGHCGYEWMEKEMGRFAEDMS